MIFEVKLDISKKSVYRFLGFKKDKNKPKKIKSIVDKTIDSLKDKLIGMVLYNVLPIEHGKDKKEIIIDKKEVFESEYIAEKLFNSSEIICAIGTIKLADYNPKSPMEELVYDAITNGALIELQNRFWTYLVEILKKEKKGLTRSYSPGENNWDLKEQKKLFNIIPAKEIGVKLNDYYMMEPIKSLSFVYGVTPNMDFDTAGHNCRECSNVDCIYRCVRHEVIVNYNNEKKVIQVDDNSNLFEVLIKNGYEIENSCGGLKTCGKCIVYIDEKLNISSEEEEILEKRKLPSNSRLSCYVSVTKDINVTIPSKYEYNQILIKGNFTKNQIKPRVYTKIINVQKPTLEDQRDFTERIFSELKVEKAINREIMNKLINLIKKDIWQLNIICDSENIINCVDKIEYIPYGLAIDIGTTTIALYLINMSTGEIVDTWGILNPQKKYGSDVITRINYTIANENGIQEMKNIIIDKLNKEIEKLCSKNHIESKDIYEAVVAGNTTMIHMFLGVDCTYIRESPFIPSFTHMNKVDPKEIKLNINKTGNIITLPCKSAYVGADTLSALLAVKMHKSKSYNLLIDIGTNGEMVIGNKDKLLCCSTAAGPAFEGAGISCGIGGVNGAIDKVDLSKKEKISTINNEKACGICGSGIVDAISELLRLGIVNNRGRMKKPKELDDNNLELDNKNIPMYYLDRDRNIFVNQRDIRQIQLAKGAIYAGVEVLIEELNINIDEIDKVYIAGGFGNYLDLSSANNIKLLPDKLIDKCISVGNSAGAGAISCLVSDDSLQEITDIREKISYIELSASMKFQDRFIKALNF